MAKNNLERITLSTLPNGYQLKMGGKEFMYFNMMELLAGLMIHIGMQNPDYMDKGNILSMLFQVMIGHEWEENINSMRNRIRDMEDKLTKTISHLELVASTGDRIEPRINEITEAIRTLSDNLEMQKAENRKSLMDVRESSKTAKDTAKEFKEQSKELKKNVDAVNKCAKDIKEMREMAEKHLKTVELLEDRMGNIVPEKPASTKNANKETNGKPSKSKKEPSKSKKTTTKSAGGRNKEADAAVEKIAEEQHMAEMEEKLKEHWDKKGWE